jgi:hypothetical protein
MCTLVRTQKIFSIVGKGIEEGKGWLSNLANCRLVDEPHFLLPPPPRGVVGVDRILEALFGRDGSDHGIRIAGRKSEARGGVMGRGDFNAGHALKGAHFSSNVFVKPFRDV